jgi:hypothetical protein
MMPISRLIIFTGHFGSGKTEISINLALQLRKSFERVAISDLDVINPYFRSRDVADLFTKEDIKLIAPSERLSNADLPIVSSDIYRYISDESYKLIIDAGGDKDGAISLGQFYNYWKGLKPEVVFVLNANRPNVSTVEGAIKSIESIEQASRLKVTSLINNTNLGSETTSEDIIAGYKVSKGISEKLNIPIITTTINKDLVNEKNDWASIYDVLYIERYMKSPWEA